ncbi:hypothetical protein [Burkholderia sp. LMU1-1-1.1]|uniref:hypothetical protein n=1 Tax=Burkholderia sp. LMU1-1-1.1 TaxID=3135266 RepID=UPI003426C5A7
MTPTPLSAWLAFGQASLAMCRQLNEASQAGLKQAGARSPDRQAALALSLKNALDLGQQWKQLQGEVFTSLLHTQLTALKSQGQSVPLRDMLALRQSLSDDLAARRSEAVKALAARAEACIDDLCRANGGEEIAIVVAGFAEDVGGTLRGHTEQSFTLLNAAGAAATVLTHRALDEAIAAAPSKD